MLTRTIKLLLVLFAINFCAAAQQQTAAAPTANAPSSADANLHENVIKLVELAGVRQHMLDNLDKMILAGQNQMMTVSPETNPAFIAEWGKRMHAQTNIDDYVNIVISVYEKHFTNNEIEELIQAQRDSNASKTSTFSPALQEKLTSQGIAIQSEILGGCSQVGAKLGGEIGQAIGTEHPEWVKKPQATAQSPTTKQ